MQSSINIVMATNENYAPHVAVAVASIICNKKPSSLINIHVLYSSLSQDSIDNIKAVEKLDKNDSTKISFIHVENELKNQKLFKWFPPEACLRLYIPKLFPNLDKIVYIDPDLIVEQDIALLHNIDLENNYIAGIKDLICVNLIKSKMLTTYKGKKISWHQYYQELGLNNNQLYNYMQSGVLIFNIKKIIEDGLTDHAFDVINKYDDFIFADQDVLNIAFKDNIKYIDTRWNFTDPRLQLLQNNLNYDEDMEAKLARENPYIIHYTGQDKPWKLKKNYILLYWKNYWNYRQLTPYKISNAQYKKMIAYNAFRSALKFLISTKENKSFFRLKSLGITLELNWTNVLERFKKQK